MARNDSERGRKTPDHLAQMKDSTSNDGNEPSFSSDLDNSAVSTPSLADDIFSPSVSIVTDFTDDYEWETPVKSTSITRAENINIVGSPQDETQDKTQRTEDLSKPDKGLDTQKSLKPTEFFTLGQEFPFPTKGAQRFEPRRVSGVGSARKSTPKTVVSRTEIQDVDHVPTKPASQSIPEITLSPPDVNRTDHKVGDAKTPPSKNILLGDGTIQHVLSVLSNQAFSSSLSKKEQNSINKSLSKILPIEIRERLEEDTHHCTALTTRNQRCKMIHETSHPKLIQCLDSITKLESSQLPKCLNDMISTALCSTTHQRMAREELKNWRADIEKLCKIHADMKESTSVSADDRLLALANYIDILSGGKGLPQRQSIVSSSPKVEKSDHSITSQGGFRLMQFFNPYSYIAKKLQKLSVSEAIERLLLKPLTKNEIEKAGIIYVYWQPLNFGHLKIGYTAQALEKRMETWIRKCNKAVEVYYPKQDDTQGNVAVKHVCRVERLIHMELKNLRKIEKNCSGCRKNHIEWFECPPDLAIAVVRKWIAWMRELPYEKKGSGSSEKWVLKPEQRSKLKTLSEPMREVSVSAHAMEKGQNKDSRQAKRLSTGRTQRMRSKSH